MKCAVTVDFATKCGVLTQKSRKISKKCLTNEYLMYTMKIQRKDIENAQRIHRKFFRWATGESQNQNLN